MAHVLISHWEAQVPPPHAGDATVLRVLVRGEVSLPQKNLNIPIDCLSAFGGQSISMGLRSALQDIPRVRGPEHVTLRMQGRREPVPAAAAWAPVVSQPLCPGSAWSPASEAGTSWPWSQRQGSAKEMLLVFRHF